MASLENCVAPHRGQPESERIRENGEQNKMRGERGGGKWIGRGEV